MNKTSSATCQLTTKNILATALFSLSLSGGAARVGNVELTGILSIEREDGSGKRFNVTGYDLNMKKVTLYVETCD